MACQGDTGQGGTLTLSVTGAVGRIRSIQLPTWAMESIDMTALDSTGFTCKTAGDVSDAGELTAEVIFDTAVGIPALGSTEDATVEFPIMDEANSVAATFVGSGFLTEATGPNMATGELMVMNITFTYDGDVTPPAFTAEATT